MSDDFTNGQRVFHANLGCYGRWLNYEPSTSGDPHGYSRVEMEDTNGRVLLCPTITLVPAGREV